MRRLPTTELPPDFFVICAGCRVQDGAEHGLRPCGLTDCDTRSRLRQR
jgi:hypothetical protein